MQSYHSVTRVSASLLLVGTTADDYICGMCGRVIQSSGPLRYAIVDGMNLRDSRVHNYPPRWNAQTTPRAGESRSTPNARPCATFRHFAMRTAGAAALCRSTAFSNGRRCQRAKQPYAIAMKDGAPFGIAGIWENWKDPASGEWL